MVRRLSWIAISLAADWMALIPLASDRRLSWIAISLAVPFFAGAATPDVHKLSPLPLRFETAADGSLVAREGPYRLSVEAGRTTVADRAHRRLASGDRAVGRREC